MKKENKKQESEQEFQYKIMNNIRRWYGYVLRMNE
jgi:hypothetical protein